MKPARHTPGPWTFEPLAQQKTRVSIALADDINAVLHRLENLK